MKGSFRGVGIEFKRHKPISTDLARIAIRHGYAHAPRARRTLVTRRPGFGETTGDGSAEESSSLDQTGALVCR